MLEEQEDTHMSSHNIDQIPWAQLQSSLVYNNSIICVFSDQIVYA